MTDSLIPKPYQYKDKWLIWPKTVLEGIQDVDCDDTVNGYCTIGKTIEECIDSCTHQNCNIGYYAKFNNGKTVCAPLYTARNPDTDQIYRLRNKDATYPELRDVDVSTFANTNVYPFPPEKANVLFYQDLISLTCIASGESVIVGEDQTPIFVEKTNVNTNLQFTSPIAYGKTEKFNQIRYGQPFCIVIPGTSLIATGLNVSMRWRSTYPGKMLAFSLLPVDKKIGDIVTYSDNFLIQYTDLSFVHVENGMLRLKYIAYEDVRHNPDFIFKATSKMLGYYCDKNVCKSVPIRDMDVDGERGRYKGVTVGRNKDCWGVCNYLIQGTNETVPYEKLDSSNFSTVFLILFVCIFIFIFIHFFYLLAH